MGKRLSYLLIVVFSQLNVNVLFLIDLWALLQESLTYVQLIILIGVKCLMTTKKNAGLLLRY